MLLAILGSDSCLGMRMMWRAAHCIQPHDLPGALGNAGIRASALSRSALLYWP